MSFEAFVCSVSLSPSDCARASMVHCTPVVIFCTCELHVALVFGSKFTGSSTSLRDGVQLTNFV